MWRDHQFRGCRHPSILRPFGFGALRCSALVKATAAAAPSGRGRRAMVPAHFLRLVGPPSCVLPAPDILQQVPRLLPLRPPSRRRIRVAEGGRCRGQYVFDPKLSVTSSLLHAARFPLLQETELMPPRLALHAGADRRVAEVQLELLACAGVTWSRLETRGMYVGRGDSGCNLRSDNGSQTKRRTYDDR